MQTVEEFAGAFPSESVLQQALAKLLSKISQHSGVQILQGSQELGKDIIFYTPGPFGEKDLNACVEKNTKITGNASTAVGARTVFNQAQQALDSPVLDENGHEQHVKRVFIITPHPISPVSAAEFADEPKFEARLIVRDKLVLITDPTHHLSSRRSVRSKELGEERLILEDTSSPLREMVVETFAKCQTSLRISVENAPLELLKEIVAPGLGVGFVPLMCEAEEVPAAN